MWREWSPDLIRNEFSEARLLGCRILRVFLLWSEFQPNIYKIDSDAIHRFDELLHIARETRIQIVPTFFIGHLDGSNFDVPWRANRDFYSDSIVTKASEHLIRFFAERYREDPYIMFWDIANEPAAFCQPSSSTIAADWIMRMRRAFKETDGSRHVTLGLDLDSFTSSKHFALDGISNPLDFISVHTDPDDSALCPGPLTDLRGTYLASFAVRLAAALSDKPVLAGGFGCSSLLSSEESGLEYYRTVLTSLFANEAIGAFPSYFSDLLCASDEPYNSMTCELGSGMMTNDGNIKKRGQAFKEFSKIVSRFDLRKLASKPCEAAIIIPRDFSSEHDSILEPDSYSRSLFNAFILAKQAGMEVRFIRADSDYRNYKLLILPGMPKTGALTWTDWQHIGDFTSYGGTVLMSFAGAAFEGMDELFGFKRRYFVKTTSAPVTFVPGSSMPGASPFTIDGRNMPRLYVNREFAALVRDQIDNPLVTFGTYGDGNTIFIAMPLEYSISFDPDFFQRSNAFKIYTHAASLAGISGPLTTVDPEIEFRRFIYDKRDLLLIVNHGAKSKSVMIAPEYCQRMAPMGQNRVQPSSNFEILGHDYLFLIAEST